MGEQELHQIPLVGIGERFSCFRIQHKEAERAMVESLRRYGQVSPVMVCEREERAAMVDGFKRLSAARQIPGMEALFARTIPADDRSAKAAIFLLNQVSSRTQELEEAWIVQALVREDGLEQQEVADLLYKVIDARYRQRSTALVANIDFRAWSDYLGDPPLAMAFLDRLVDGALIFRFPNARSYRAARSKDRTIRDGGGQETSA